jgi:polyisoprenoid-binding protein YceI
MILTRRFLIASGLASCATPLRAAPKRYRLWADTSRVAFIFDVGGTRQTGTVPVQSADIRIDTDDLTNSSAEVSADVRRAQTSIPMITAALLSPAILDADTHPMVQYRSTKVVLGSKGRISEGARLLGLLSLRGQTLPLDLNALLTRPAGSAPDDMSTLTINLRGSLSRKAYGATGFATLVADQVDLDIQADIRAV